MLREGEEWVVNAAGDNGLLTILGKPGTGKSQLALDLLAQAARQGVHFMFFDLKGELEDDPNNAQQRRNRQTFLELTQAQSVRMIRQGLPINPLVRDANPTVNAQVAYEIASLIRAFAPQLGAKQERAIAEAFQELESPDFGSLAEQLKRMGATGVELALVKKIVSLNLFAGAKEGMSPEEWLGSSLVIDFKEFHNDNATKALAVALILNFLVKRLNGNLPVKEGIQPLKMVLFVDEAHLLLPQEGKAGVLGALARQGRSWGFPVWLASQEAEGLMGNGSKGTNFAELAGCGVYFSPGGLREAQQREMLGGIVRRQLKPGEAALRLHGYVQTGQARQFWRDGGKADCG